MLGKTTFLILKDSSGQTQCVAAPDVLKDLRLKLKTRSRLKAERDPVAGPRPDLRSQSSPAVLNVQIKTCPLLLRPTFTSVALESLIEYRPLALRNPAVGNIFRIQAALLAAFREFLKGQRFTEIITSKSLASGTEGGTNLFEVKYFDRVAYPGAKPAVLQRAWRCRIRARV